jgi:hypothetical protein
VDLSLGGNVTTVTPPQRGARDHRCVDDRQRVEAYVRELVERQGLPMPDEFEPRERSIVLKWTERRVAVIVTSTRRPGPGGPPPSAAA